MNFDLCRKALMNELYKAYDILTNFKILKLMVYLKNYNLVKQLFWQVLKTIKNTFAQS